MTMGKTTKMKNMTKEIINKIFTPYPVTGYGVKIYISGTQLPYSSASTSSQ